MAAKKAMAKDHAWRKGQLFWKLFPYQKEIRKQFYENKSRKFVLKCSRRIGKTYFLVAMALEAALKKPKQRIKYAADAAKNVEGMIKPIFLELLADCPQDLAPKCTWYKGLIEFKNGSVIQLAGCDDESKVDGLRGQAADLVIVDEAGFIRSSVLQYAIRDVLFPQLLTTNGRMLIASSSARTPQHYFTKVFHETASEGAAVLISIHDAMRLGNPFLNDKVIAEFCKEAGGEESTTWKREYLALDVIDSSIAILPNWSEEVEPEVVKEVERPPFFDTYVSFDPGYRDGAGAVFGYWDFLAAKLVIEDEVLLFKKDSGIQMSTILAKEQELWGDRKPHKRVSDNDLQLIADFNRIHKMHFIPTAKDDKEAQLNALDLLIRQRKLIIHPRCKQLIRQMHTTVWNKAHTSYERNEDGHGDLLDALVYLVRNVDRNKNPYPPGALPSRDTHRIPSGLYASHRLSRMSPGAQVLKKVLK
jgi:phage terminase large subunit